MREKVEIVLVDELPTFVMQDGTVIDTDQIGYVATPYGISPDDCYYDRFTKSDVSFIIDNNVQCEIQMMEDGEIGGDRVPRLYRGKVIIHYK